MVNVSFEFIICRWKGVETSSASIFPKGLFSPSSQKTTQSRKHLLIFSPFLLFFQQSNKKISATYKIFFFTILKPQQVNKTFNRLIKQWKQWFTFKVVNSLMEVNPNSLDKNVTKKTNNIGWRWVDTFWMNSTIDLSSIGHAGWPKTPNSLRHSLNLIKKLKMMIWSKKCVRRLWVWGTASMSDTTGVSDSSLEVQCLHAKTFNIWKRNVCEKVLFTLLNYLLLIHFCVLYINTCGSGRNFRRCTLSQGLIKLSLWLTFWNGSHAVPQFFGNCFHYISVAYL